jgi:hypothetical protein
MPFSSKFKNGHKVDKWPNHFISGKDFQKGQMETLEDSANEVKRIKSRLTFFRVGHPPSSPPPSLFGASHAG